MASSVKVSIMFLREMWEGLNLVGDPGRGEGFGLLADDGHTTGQGKLQRVWIDDNKVARVVASDRISSCRFLNTNRRTEVWGHVEKVDS